MWIKQTLLLLTVLSLHTGFSFTLGILAARFRERPSTWAGSVAFLFLVYLPSCLVVIGMADIASPLRMAILCIGLISATIPWLERVRAQKPS